MKKVLLILLINLSLYSNETNTNQDLINFEAAQKYIEEIDFREKIRTAADCIDAISTKDLNVTGITNKLTNISNSTLHILSDKLSYFNVKKAQSVTYEVRVTTTKGVHSSGTAIALTSDGTLITTYHNIASYKTLEVIDHKGQRHPAKVGKVSAEHDLAYIHIDAKDIAYARVADASYLGQDIYILSHNNFLLTGIASELKPDAIVLNVEVRKGTSGAGVFNKNNELISILISKDTLHKTSRSIRPHTFKQVTDSYTNQKATHKDINDYDTSFCYNKDASEVWKEYTKSKDLRRQEIHALFKGLCNKVENRDLTSDEAQFIFESARHRLF